MIGKEQPYINVSAGVAPQWLSAQQLNSIIGLSQTTVERAIANGAPIIRRYVNSKPVYNVASINSWLMAQPEDR